MKALIIENEWEVPGEIEGFIKDNPQLFQRDEVKEITNWKNRSLEDAAKYLAGMEAVIIMSTFMYRDQLEEYVAGFASDRMPKMKFFVHQVMYKMYEWFMKDKSYLFSDLKQFRENLGAFIQKTAIRQSAKPASFGKMVRD